MLKIVHTSSGMLGKFRMSCIFTKTMLLKWKPKLFKSHFFNIIMLVFDVTTKFRYILYRSLVIFFLVFKYLLQKD